MDGTKIIRPVIIAYSFILLGLAALTGNDIGQNLFRWLSGTTGAVTLLYIVYEKWVWKWGIFRLVTASQNIPIIHGTWKGTLDYDEDHKGNPGNMPIYVTIEQTMFTVRVNTFVETSESYAITAKIEKSPKFKKQLVYFYRSVVPVGKRKANRPHEGACVLNIIGSPATELSGDYFTERGGTGRITLKQHNRKTVETLDQAKLLEYS